MDTIVVCALMNQERTLLILDLPQGHPGKEMEYMNIYLKRAQMMMEEEE